MKLKGYKTKEIIMAAILSSILLMNMLALCFAVVSGGITYLSGSESYFANGFTLAFDGYPIIVEGCGMWLRASSILHFIVAVLEIVTLAIYFAVRGFKFGKLALALCIISEAFSVLYMINGIIAYSVASDYASLYFDVSTLAFIPFILITLLFAAALIVKKKMPDNFKF